MAQAQRKQLKAGFIGSFSWEQSMERNCLTRGFGAHFSEIGYGQK